MENGKINLSQVGLYNPQRLEDTVVERLFLVRIKLFQFLIERIQREKPDGIPQHYLIIAQRGMGKTMLLKRIEVELRKEQLKDKFIPLLLPEEQYNIINLSRFWINSLDALADTLEYENKTAEADLVDKEINRLEKIGDEEERARESYKFLISFTDSLNRRPVLLIDNMSLIFDRLNRDEQHVLRAWLMQNGAPILIGASVIAIEETFNYGAPFYDAFQIHYLKKLTFDEVLNMIQNLVHLTQEEEILPSLNRMLPRLKTLHQLTGGNPRTVVILFKIIIKGFSNDINKDLEALLDEITPLYKARFEELSTQMQVIVDAIALYWDPITLETLRKETSYGNNQLSPQIKRLVDSGWIETVKAFRSKGNAYQISERFFNIWFLMRRSSRRKKRELYCLAKFLEIFYGKEIITVASQYLSENSERTENITYGLALSEVVTDAKLKEQLKEKSYANYCQLIGKNPEILEKFDFSSFQESRIGYFKEMGTKIQQEIKNQNYLSVEKILLELLDSGIGDENIQSAFYQQLGNFYLEYLGKFDDAEKAYLKAIELDQTLASPWNNLGNLYQDHLKKFDEAEKAYRNALLISNESVFSLNLIFLLRDKMNRGEEAKTLFDTLHVENEFMDTYWLHQALFELYKSNSGQAKESLEKALNHIGDQLPQNTQDDWWRFGAIVNKLGYGNWLLAVLEEKGYDTILAPYYVAIKAMNEKDREGYLNSKAVEIREPARMLMDYLEKYK
jgi:tetratricopeptide (TPR) repeat protein